MNAPEIFLRELWKFWPMTCAGAVGLSIGLVVRFASDGCLASFTRTKSFPELAAFTKDYQRRLLREASRDAFSALYFAPALVFLAFVWGGGALASTLQKVIPLPIWVMIVLFGLFLGLGYWLGRRLDGHRVRPFLMKLIGGQKGKTVA